MSDTHPNAFRNEAQEKRLEAARLITEAEALETQAALAEGTQSEEQKAEPAVVEEPAPVDKPSVFKKK